MSHHHGVGVLRAHDEFGSSPVVVAYGAGVDSTAMLIGLRDRSVDLALIMFADTGSEKPETMAYLPIMKAWLERQGMPLIHRVKRRSRRAGDTSLHGECLRKSVLPSLAYGGHSCSLKWKVGPQWASTRDFLGWDRRQQRWPTVRRSRNSSATMRVRPTHAGLQMPLASGRQDIATGIP